MTYDSPAAPASDMNNAGQTQFPPEMDSVQQAQREWRMRKRRELEAKVRKRQFKARAALPTPHSYAEHTAPMHAGPVHSAALYAASMPLVHAMSTPLVHAMPPHGPHSASGAMQPGVLLADAQAAVHAAAHGGVTGGGVAHRVVFPGEMGGQVAHVSHDVQEKLTQERLTGGGLGGEGDPAASSMAALQQHLHSNAKRSRMAMEGGENTNDMNDATAAAAAAAAHAAATAAPGNAQFASAVAIAAAPGRSHQDGTGLTQGGGPSAGVLRASQQPAEATQQQIAEQLEAERQWREEKRREIAAKKAKGSASKRGRKKTRLTPPSTPHSGYPNRSLPAASLQPPCVRPSISTVFAPDGAGPASSAAPHASEAVSGDQQQSDPMTADEAAAMYVRAMAEGRSSDTGGAGEQQEDVEMQSLRAERSEATGHHSDNGVTAAGAAAANAAVVGGQAELTPLESQPASARGAGAFAGTDEAYGIGQHLSSEILALSPGSSLGERPEMSPSKEGGAESAAAAELPSGHNSANERMEGALRNETSPAASGNEEESGGTSAAAPSQQAEPDILTDEKGDAGRGLGIDGGALSSVEAGDRVAFSESVRNGERDEAENAESAREAGKIKDEEVAEHHAAVSADDTATGADVVESDERAVGVAEELLPSESARAGGEAKTDAGDQAEVEPRLSEKVETHGARPPSPGNSGEANGKPDDQDVDGHGAKSPERDAGGEEGDFGPNEGAQPCSESGADREEAAPTGSTRGGGEDGQKRDEEGKPEEGTDTFPADNGEDIMTAAAWQSLDSIGN